MSVDDYLDEEGRAYPTGPQEQPPNPTPAPAPAFHDELSGAIASLANVGRGLGDARLNSIVPSLFFQAEEKRRHLEATCKRLGEQKDQAERDASALRVDVAKLQGEIESLKADARTRAAEVTSEARTTKLALGLAALLFPMAIGLFPDKPWPGFALLILATVSGVIGLYPKALNIFEKGSK
ncbi:TPA: hypothetical protein RNS57_002443 [Stenotrophomonas maltophilia]|uniref:PspA/IM30 family protein n=1 Tax=Stenotrophomonas maltophilia TaxID=40324 RepID=UPI00117F35EF|nr:hypothetical protein [Stenotrophomonas maltophilia]HDX0794175.1 hypothetical protein [Stenotrophomonas maltophilia]HDX0798379.1 hypothetical protein [Stenotrophomonas maltophilia]HDX0941012.1 hypothetical protein [Stenotrophomonas maltophilia]